MAHRLILSNSILELIPYDAENNKFLSYDNHNHKFWALFTYEGNIIKQHILTILPHYTHIYLNNCGINNNNLWCINDLHFIELLDLSNNYIYDLSPINNIKLHSLSLQNNFITNINNLITLSSLTYLDISHNKIEEFDIHHLTNLKYFNCSHNKIKRISLDNDNLLYLNISFNNIDDINISSISLLTLQGRNNNISNIISLLQCPNLEDIRFEYNKITDISCISYLKNLKNFNIDNNNVSKFTICNII